MVGVKNISYANAAYELGLSIAWAVVSARYAMPLTATPGIGSFTPTAYR